MDIIKLILPVIGVIVGFLLSWLKEWIQYKAIIKTETKSGGDCGFGYYYIDKYGSPRQTHEFSNAEYLELNITVDIYNVGRKNSAIKDVEIEIYYKDEFFRRDTPKLVIYNQEFPTLSFNLKSGEILPLQLSFKYEKEEENQFLFNNDDDDAEDSSLYFKIVITDVYGRKYHEKINPFYFHLAAEAESEVAAAQYIHS